MIDQPSPSNSASHSEELPSAQPSLWQARYSQKHRPQRLKEFPAGIEPPRRVRIYRRGDHFLLQWWDKARKRTLSERVNGDLLAVLSRARAVDEQLEQCRSARPGSRRTKLAELVAHFRHDLESRVEAAEVDLATASRYGAALEHFQNYLAQPDVQRRYRHCGDMDRQFQLEFAAYLQRTQISPNGRDGAAKRPMRSKDYVQSVVRSMFEWAADPERGNLLPDGFRNPFSARSRSTERVGGDLVSGPEITVAMAVQLIEAADDYQVSILAPLLLYGLRPGELGWLFAEHSQGGWLRVQNIPELGYLTKGRRDKRFPLAGCVQACWQLPAGENSGLLLVSRAVAEGRRRAPLYRQPLTALVATYARRCSTAPSQGAAARRKLRDKLLQDAGQVDYDAVQGEFQSLARRLGWPACATLKDLRHLFATCLENAGVPEFYRRYLMGHSLGRAPIVTYTHLSEDKLFEHYQRALTTELAPLVQALENRLPRQVA